MDACATEKRFLKPFACLKCMAESKLFFDMVKEDRGRYFVEYRPPIPSYRFASLQLVFPEQVETESVAQAMEAEADVWLRRYPVAIMISAFDGTAGLIHMTSVRNCDHLFAFCRDGDHQLGRAWRLLREDELPDEPLDGEYLKRTYSCIPFKTEDQLQRESQAHIKALRMGWFLVFIWLIIIPATIAILGWASPWIGAIVMLYSLSQGIVKALKMTGKWKSRRELEREEVDYRMRHHHYHCERNPDGFLRLKLENFERDERTSIRQEADMLKTQGRGGKEGETEHC